MAYYNFQADGAGGKAYYLGELAHGATMDVSTKFEGYSNLTADNFLVVPKNGSASQSSYSGETDFATSHYRIDISSSSTYTAPTVSYNAANGQLSFSSTINTKSSAECHDPYGGQEWLGANTNTTVGLTAKIYLVTEIEAL